MALVLLTATPRFDTNDDMGLQSVADGSLTGEPSPDLVVTNAILGLLLQGLYQTAGSFPWYGTYLYLVHFAALAALAYAVFSGRREHLGSRVLLLAGVVAAFQVPMWLELQFTSTALLLGVTGVVLFRSAADRKSTAHGAIAAAGVMVGIAWWIRWRTAGVAILLGMVALAPALRRSNLRRFAALALVVLAVVAAGWAVQAAYYGDRPDWQEYFAFNEVRGQLHQTSGLSEVDPTVLAEVGWSENDLRMFSAWFFTDPAVYQTEDLETIAAAVPASFEAREAADLLGSQAAGWSGGLRLTLTAFLGLLAWLEGDRRTRWTVAASALASVAIAFALAATVKLPDRVALPMTAFLAVLFLVTLSAPGTPDPPRPAVRGRPTWWWAAAVVSVCALAIGVPAAAAASRANETLATTRRAILARINEFDPDGVFIAWPGEMPRWVEPLAPPARSGPGATHLVPLGWMQQSPTQRDIFARYGIDDLYAAIAASEVYLPLRSVESEALYLTYLREHYGFSGLLLPVARVGFLTVFQGAAAYEVDEAAGTLVESRFDGGTAAYSIAGPAAEGSATARLDEAGRLEITGRAEADLIVAVDGTAAVGLALPLPSEDRLPRFRLTLEPPPADLRLFALSDGVAREITVASEVP